MARKIRLYSSFHYNETFRLAIMIQSGIYSITNTINGKIYYGSSNNIHNRWNEHRNNLNKNKHKNGHLQGSWNKYGESNFKFEIVKEVEVERLLDVEQEYLNECKETPELFYNIATNATASMRGRKHSDEYKKKLSIYFKGRYCGKNSSQYGIIHTDEYKRNMSNILKGRTFSEEHKKNLSEAAKKRKYKKENI